MKVAVIIPCRNEQPYIRECIEAIYDCELPQNCELEVIIIDGKSNDGTLKEISELKSKYPSLRLITNEKQLTPFAFNLGIKACNNCNFYQIIGARHIVSVNYIKSCIEKLESNKDIWCVGGRIINEFTNDTSRVISSAMSTSFGMGLGNFRTLNKSGFTDTVTSPMYPAWVFEKIGYFDEELIRNQDDDFNYRVTNAGGKIYYNNDISLKYYVRGNYNGLWKQFFQYGYWKVYVNKKHKAVTTLRQLVPPLFVVYIFLLVLTPFFSIFTAVIFGVPIAIYILMAIYFLNNISKQDKQIGFLDILLTFPILHISYGLGYLKGVLTFLILSQKPSEKQKELSR